MRPRNVLVVVVIAIVLHYFFDVPTVSAVILGFLTLIVLLLEKQAL